MHIPDGFLDGKTCASAFGAAGAALAWALRRVHARWNDKTVPLMGVMSAFLFAGQMVNFPIAGGTSGHLQGGVLAAVFLGPSGAAIVMATVLFIQCFFFQDGGATTLGANLLNLGVIGVAAGYWVFRQLSRWLRGNRGLAVSAAAASWFAVVCASVACSIELSAAKTVPLQTVLPVMALTHAVIGLGEALITGAIVSFVLKVRPDLLDEPTNRNATLGRIQGCWTNGWRNGAALRPRRDSGIWIYGLLFSISVALLVSPFASSLPDGLEFLATRLNFRDRAAQVSGSPEFLFATNALDWLPISLAAGLGTLAAFVLAWGIGRWLRRPRSETNVD